MSKYLATYPRLSGEAATVEARLADIIENSEVVVSDYHLTDIDRAKVIAALRSAVDGDAYERGWADAVEACAKLAEAFDLPMHFSGIKPRIDQVEKNIAAGIRALSRS